jgi:ATP-dependent Clp protease adaptor protein ClpS
VETTTAPAPVQAPVEAPSGVGDPTIDEVNEPDIPWVVIVWNDPINLMTYVTWVLQKLFGYPKATADKLMMDVHTKGKAVVSNGSRDEAERDVARLHAYGLWATMQKDR